MALEYFPCFYSYRGKIAKLSDQEVGRLFRRLLEYGETGECEELTGREAVAFDFIAYDIDRAKNEYNDKCEKLKANADKRYNNNNANASNCMQLQANVCNCRETETKTETESKTESLKKRVQEKSSRFLPPTVEEVQAYCNERNNGIDAELFIDFYAARHWMTGKTAVKDWKACVRTWEKRAKKAEENMNCSFDTDEFFNIAVKNANREDD